MIRSVHWWQTPASKMLCVNCGNAHREHESLTRRCLPNPLTALQATRDRLKQ